MPTCAGSLPTTRSSRSAAPPEAARPEVRMTGPAGGSAAPLEVVQWRPHRGHDEEDAGARFLSRPARRPPQPGRADVRPVPGGPGLRWSGPGHQGRTAIFTGRDGAVPEQVPVIDLAPWFDGDAGDRAAVAQQVDRALRTSGFLLVTGAAGGPGRGPALADLLLRAEPRRRGRIPARAHRPDQLPAGHRARIPGQQARRHYRVLGSGLVPGRSPDPLASAVPGARAAPGPRPPGSHAVPSVPCAAWRPWEPPPRPRRICAMPAARTPPAAGPAR